MFRALSVLTRWWFVPFLGAVLPAVSAHVATAQSWADSTAHYAEWQTPKEKPFSLHLHGGLFSRVDLNSPSPTVGLRLSRLVNSYLQAGVLAGWTMERKDETERVSSRPGPAPRLLLSRVDAHLVPLMGFLRVNFTEKSWFLPYFGAGVGYEWLKLQATDYRTQVASTATFSNWAWEGWVALASGWAKTCE